MNPVILGVVAILAAFATALANVDNMLRGHSWLAPYLYGTCGVLLVIAAVNALFISRRETKADTTRPPIQQEFTQTQSFNPTLNIGFSDSQRPRSAALVSLENGILEFLKCRPNGFYSTKEVAGHMKMGNRQTWELLEGLQKQGRVYRGKADVKGGAIWNINDLEL